MRSAQLPKIPVLIFFPMQDEEYDFIIPNKRLKRQEVRQFINLLQEANIQSQLNKLGLSTDVPV